MKRTALKIGYIGTNFHGFQRQPDLRTVEEELIYHLRKLGYIDDLKKSRFRIAGRTDAGVHSFGQVANFKTNSNIPISKMALAINSQVKNSIRIVKAEEVDENFHSRYCCKRKTYRYVINNSVCGSSIYRNLEYHMPIKLDVDKMKKAIKYFEGEHDFKAFKSSGTSSKSSVRTIYKAELKQDGDRIIIELTGNGFLYNMVRIISGTLVDVGLGKIAPDSIPEIIEKKDRTKAGKTLPPQGLFLLKVEYEN